MQVSHRKSDKYYVEHDFVTKAGLRAIVLMVRWGEGRPEDAELLRGRNGYLHVPAGNALCGRPYDVFDGAGIDVHGGWTYGGRPYFLESDDQHSRDYWVGFDCAHAGDAYIEYPSFMSGLVHDGDVVRDMDYVVEELERAAQLLVEFGDKANQTAGSFEQLMREE